MAESREITRKKEEVSTILASLEKDLQQKQSNRKQSNVSLSRLKVLGRDSKGAEAITEIEGLRILARHGLENDADDAALEALRCLANALLLVSESRQRFVNLGFVPIICEKLHDTESVEAEFLYARILFVLTYETDLDYGNLIEKCRLRDSILKHIDHYGKSPSSQINEPMKNMAISEILKLLFNITHHNPSLSSSFSTIVHPLLIILQHSRLDYPLDPPFSHIINILLNLDLETNKDSIFPSSDPHTITNKIIDLLNAAILTTADSDPDAQLSPLFTLIRRLYPIAPEPVQETLRHRLLPSAAERNLPLGAGDTLPSRLLRLSTSARTPELRDLVLGLMYDLSGGDAERFVRNVGYGYASGFLVNHNIATPAGLPRDDRAADGGGGDGNGNRVNFVTGQYLAAEQPDSGPQMTEEEREREAERLFVLFERLRATGVVDVRNPVEVAAREGRLEEMSDSDDEE